eukprot:GILK01008583.1.p1 GENE.GILK01008583.1~~GILK01008583.1.p1  ORF type:complete len:398 (+),score=50.77 GILK01008583.1:41-1195(+)
MDAQQGGESANEDMVMDQEEAKHFQDVCNAFLFYKRDASRDLARMQWNFNILKPEHQNLLTLFPPEAKSEAYDRALDVNQNFLISCVVPHQELFHGRNLRDISNNGENAARTPYRDVTKVRSTLRQFVRDWSKEGAAERAMCYEPIIAKVKEYFPSPLISAGGATSRVSILVPGSGLGRLAFEFARLGYRSQGNEFSYFMLLGSNFILNNSERIEQFSLQPYVHCWSNIVKAKAPLCTVQVPDVCPGDILLNDIQVGSEIVQPDFSMCAGEFVEVYRQQIGAWDCITTCFFLDTARNVIEYIETMSKILRPGGVWINFGPLLYHYADMEDEKSIELSWEEILPIIQYYGFELKHFEMRKSTYTANPDSMMNVLYNCLFFTAIKQ